MRLNPEIFFQDFLSQVFSSPNPNDCGVHGHCAGHYAK